MRQTLAAKELDEQQSCLLGLTAKLNYQEAQLSRLSGIIENKEYDIVELHKAKSLYMRTVEQLSMEVSEKDKEVNRLVDELVFLRQEISVRACLMHAPYLHSFRVGRVFVLWAIFKSSKSSYHTSLHFEHFN